MPSRQSTPSTPHPPPACHTQSAPPTHPHTHHMLLPGQQELPAPCRRAPASRPPERPAPGVTASAAGLPSAAPHVRGRHLHLLARLQPQRKAHRGRAPQVRSALAHGADVPGAAVGIASTRCGSVAARTTWYGTVRYGLHRMMTTVASSGVSLLPAKCPRVRAMRPLMPCAGRSRRPPAAPTG
jgi:hypothetical protein